MRAPDTANARREKDNGQMLVIAVTANVSGQQVLAAVEGEW